VCGAARTTQVPRAVPVVERPPDERMSDVDRRRSADLLTAAAGDGLLDLPEVDRRLTAVWRAVTAADLAAAQDGLPGAWLDARRARERAEAQRRAARAAAPEHLRSYLRVMTLLVAIWAVVGVTTGAWYPWPVWPALGWGIGVAAHLRSAYGHRDDAAALPAG
jgi:hypothetical protein